MEGHGVRFRILGPLEVVDESGRMVVVGGRKPRSVLGILLLHANEVVPVSRLIDDLWGEEPPDGAAKALQIAVSRLRKALGAAAALVETRPGGYAIRVDDEQLDLLRFDRLEREGREALARGDPEQAAALLEHALALWRGPALSEFAQEEFGHEAARLAERRLAVTEDRIDAELALGRHGLLVAELGRLVEEYPFRERLRGQLMVALGRSGRQADALRVYDDGRRRLVEELGIEPGPALRDLQVAILRQEPSAVEAPPRAATPVKQAAVPAKDGAAEAARPQEIPSRRKLLGALLGVVVLAATGIAVLVVVGRGDGGAAAVEDDVVALVDPRERVVAATVDVGERPGAVAAGLGSIWVASRRDATIARIDPSRRRIERTIGLGFEPSGLAVGADGVWVTDAEEGALVRFNAVTGAPVKTFDVGRGGPGAVGVAVGEDAVWVANSNAFLVIRIDPRENREVDRVAIDAPRFIAAGPEGVWVVSAGTAVVEIDPTTNEPSARLETGFTAGGLALGADSVWVSYPEEDSVWRFHAPTERLLRTIPVGRGPRALAFGSGSLWVVNTLDGSVSMLDPETNEEVATVRLGGRPASLAADGRAVWATVAPR